MTAVQPAHAPARLARLSEVAGLARAVLFVIAIGVFLAAPPSLPWAIALVAATHVVFLTARASTSSSRPPISLLVLNGLTVTLVIAYTVLTSAVL